MPRMPTHLTHTLLVLALVISAAVWVGGYVAIVVVARAATTSLDRAGRIALFRALGRAYLRVGIPALLIAYGCGAGLLRDHPVDPTVIITAVTAAVLLAVLVLGVLQARRMTHLRLRALAAPQGLDVQGRVTAAARRAAGLRGVIGLLSLTLVILGSILAG